MTMSKADRLRLSIYGILVFSGIAIVFALCIWVTYKLAKLVKSKVQTDEGLVSLLKKSLVNDKKMKSTVNHILNERKEDKYITNDAIPRRLLKITKNIETLGTALIVRLNYLVKSESISENSPINLTERSNKIMSDTNQNLENGNDINIRASSSIMDSKNIRSRPKSVIKSGTRENIDSIVDLNIDKRDVVSNNTSKTSMDTKASYSASNKVTAHIEDACKVNILAPPIPTIINSKATAYLAVYKFCFAFLKA